MRPFPLRFTPSLLIWTLAFLLPRPADAARQLVGATDGVKRVHLLYTNDIHGFLSPREASFMNPDFPPGLGGAPALTKYIADVRAQAAADGEGVLLLDGGDIFQGTRVGERTRGRAITDWMKAVGYDAMVLGNHDFDLGWDLTKQIAETSSFPVLAANVAPEGSQDPVYWAPPYTVVEKEGVRFGIVGLVTRDTEGLTGADQIAGLDFLPIDETMRRYMTELEVHDVDVVMALGHLGVPPDWSSRMDQLDRVVATPPEERQQGLNAQDLARAVPGIHVIVGGHIHWGLREPYEDPITHTLCVQTYGKLSGVGHIILLIDEETQTLAGYELAHAEGSEVTLFSDYNWPDPAQRDSIGAKVAIAEAGMDEVLANLEVNLPRGTAEHALGQVVTDAFLAAAEADVAFTNRGGIRTELRRGPITSRHLFEVLPFNNELVTYDVDGTQLMEMLETGVRGGRRDLQLAGARITVDRSREDGDKITAATVAGAAVDPNARYRVVTTSYLASGAIGWDLLPKLSETPVGLTDLDALINYFSANSPLQHDFEPRIHRIGGS